MPVTPNAAPGELDSPFFIANEEICQSFDQFIVSNGGETRGKYNAFSYNVLGKVRHSNKWEFRIKKSTFTSGNLLLSSEYQNLHIASIWTARSLQSDCPDFLIRRNKFLDGIRISFSKKWNWFTHDKRYVIRCRNRDHNLIKDMKDILKHLFDVDCVWEVHYNNPVLIIDLRANSSHTATIEKLLAKNYA